jgi:hypothetical protein
MFYPNRRDVLKTLGAIFAWDGGFDNFTTRTRRE